MNRIRIAIRNAAWDLEYRIERIIGRRLPWNPKRDENGNPIGARSIMGWRRRRIGAIELGAYYPGAKGFHVRFWMRPDPCILVLCRRRLYLAYGVKARRAAEGRTFDDRIGA